MKNHSFVQFLFTYRTIFMKAYIFLLSLGLFASTQFIKAQESSYSIFPGTVDMSWDYTEDLDMKAYISSSSMLNQDIEYTVTALDIPEQWQDLIITQFCDVQSCYDFRWFKLGDKKEMKLFANQKNGILKVDFLLPSSRFNLAQLKLLLLSTEKEKQNKIPSDFWSINQQQASKNQMNKAD
jgi:hypothetical protein